MPPEWAPHERTLMAWPCRPELWGGELGQAKADYAQAANAIAAFEPVTMVCDSPGSAKEARRALTGDVEILELPIDDSWLRDSGPIFVIDDEGERVGVHFGFNAWGGKFPPWDRDAAVGGLLARRYGDRAVTAPFVLEGGAICVGGRGTLVTTEQCLLNPNRNPSLSREEIEQGLREHLGVERIVWLGDGLAEDRDTDGHVDLIAGFAPDGRLLLQSAPPGDPNHDAMAANRSRAESAGLEVLEMPFLPRATVAGEEIVCSYMNYYLCNGAVIVGLAEQETDAEALRLIGAAYPDREAVGVRGLTIAFGGGGPHCITQQVPLKQ
jgi:agmatine deiminase